jgi:RNA polymerase sigma factor (sigma-70 family)
MGRRNPIDCSRISDADVRRYEPACRRVARAWRGSADYEDCLQEARLIVLRALVTYDPDNPRGATLSTYVLECLQHAHARIRRDGQGLLSLSRSAYERGERVQQPLSLDAPQITTDGDPYTLVDLLADPSAGIDTPLFTLRMIIDTLPDPLRRMVQLCCIDGFSQTDAGRMLGLGQMGVHHRMARARRKLVRELARER